MIKTDLNLFKSVNIQQLPVPLHIGIVGARNRNLNRDYTLVVRTFFELVDIILGIPHKNVIVISGGAVEGADYFTKSFTDDFDIKYREYGPSKRFPSPLRYYLRNTLIAKHSFFLIACRSYNRRGGTEYTIKEFLKHHPNDRLITV